MMLLGISSSLLLGGALLLNQSNELDTRAEAIDSSVEVYVDVSQISWFGNDGCFPKIYVYNDDNDNDHISSKSNANGIYCFDLPTRYANMIIERCNNTTNFINESDSFSYDSDYNLYRLGDGGSKLTITSTYHHEVAASTTYYVSVDAVTYDWFGDHADTYIYGFSGTDHFVIKGSRVKGGIYLPSVNTNLITITFTEARYMDFMIIVRGTSDFDGGDWNKRYNQSQDISFTKDSISLHGVVLNESAQATLREQDITVANVFGNKFLSYSFCKDEGGVTSYASTQFDPFFNNWYPCYKANMSEDYLKNLSSEGDEPVHQALRRYDAIISKNPYREEQFTDHLKRNPSLPSSGSYLVNVETNKMSSLPLLVSSIAIGVISIAGYAFLKGRKEHE